MATGVPLLTFYFLRKKGTKPDIAPYSKLQRVIIKPALSAPYNGSHGEAPAKRFFFFFRLQAYKYKGFTCLGI